MYLDVNSSLCSEQTDIPLSYVYELGNLVSACEEEKVYIKSVKFFQNGFIVFFKDIDGYAIIHNNSYGHVHGMLVTKGMPWDNNGVSAHSPESLAMMLRAYLDGRDTV